jgi:hypothetical protein
MMATWILVNQKVNYKIVATQHYPNNPRESGARLVDRSAMKPFWS